MECHSAIKRHRLLRNATTWMDLKNIILSEKIPTQKTTYCLIRFIQNVQRKKMYASRKQIRGCLGQAGGGGVGAGRQGLTPNGYEVAF